MKKQKINNVRLGLFVVVASILFIVGVYLIGINKNLFGDNFVVSTILTNAGGLQAGNNVRYAGINVGTVEGISIISDSTLKVDLKLVDRVKPYIKKNALATVSVDGIVGSALVSIIPGNGSAAMIEEGDILAAAELPGTADLMSTLGNTNQNLHLITRDLLTVTGRIKEDKGPISRLISDSLMADNLGHTLNNLSQSTQSLVGIMQKLERTVDELQSSRGLLHQLTHDTLVMQNLHNISNSLNTQVTEKLDSVMGDLAQSGNNIREITTEFKSLLDTLKKGKGTLNTLVHDEELSHSILEIIENIEGGTAKFEEDMEALKHNFLFRRYFRKQEKQRQKDGKTRQP